MDEKPKKQRLDDLLVEHNFFENKSKAQAAIMAGDVKINDKVQKLTPIEFDIFNLLFQNHGNMVSSAKLLKEIWGYSPDDDVETIRVHIRHLRSKIDKISNGKKYIETIYGGGYKLNI